MQADRFWDRIARKYYQQPVPSEADYQRKLALSREHFTTDSEVVEFGCGTGTTAVKHAPFVKRYRAVDISARMLDIARTQAAEAQASNVEFIQGTLFDLQLPDASVDAVLGMSILHLLPNRDETLVEVHRILKPGGVFISSTACVGEKMAWFRYLVPLGQRLGLLPLLSVFKMDELRTAVLGAGFQVQLDWVPDSSPMVCVLVATKG
ncbi:class I SAM-dependent methyltransferase [Saccharospirillum mangrovi]|uniref:class I SAM-dependent methyltransferase n=1 Tax=Saccharospirillum mangrovi TaxID=2161747 RepID=UPI0013006E11|nr:class I SAM-dependent methyltransferase [Saccharospirillum mangrovi]